MAESSHNQQPLSVVPVTARRIGSFNYTGLWTLIQKETARFMSVYVQTIAAPMVTAFLYYTVFALAFGGVNRMVGHLPYMVFLAPGLIMMTMTQNAFANTSSSLMISKVQGNIVDVLMAPLSALELLLGYIIAGVVRGLLVGIACTVMIIFFVHLPFVSISTVFVYAILGTLMLSILGVIAGLWSEKFDHMAAITNFVIMPMTFLSGTFYSVKLLPPFWQAVAHSNPFFFMIDGVRYGMTGYAESDLLEGMTMLVVYNAGLMVFAYGLFVAGYKTKQ